MRRAAIVADGLGVRFQFDSDGRVVTPTVPRIRRHVTDAWGLRDDPFAAGTSP